MAAARGAGRGGRVLDEDDAEGAAAPGAAALRIDRWLWHARFYKTRSLAAEAVAGGRVHLNDARTKPAHPVRVGDRLTVSQGGQDRVVEVRAIPVRRGSAPEARLAYEETAASLAAGAALADARRLAALSVPRSEGRPDKKERRLLLALARAQGRR